MSHALNHQIPNSQSVVPSATDLTRHSQSWDVGMLPPANQESILVGGQKQHDPGSSTCYPHLHFA